MVGVLAISLLDRGFSQIKCLLNRVWTVFNYTNHQISNFGNILAIFWPLATSRTVHEKKMNSFLPVAKRGKENIQGG